MNNAGAERVWEPGLVSIIIPTYKRPKDLRIAVESALAQTYQHIEVVVVSDGPDPEARAAVEGLNGRVHYDELPVNRGPAEARNHGVRISKGEWFTFLDDDDTIMPTKVEHQLQLADPANPQKMIACRVLYVRGTQEDVHPERPIGPEEDVADYILVRPSLLGRPGVLPLQALLVHHSIMEQVPFAGHADHEDWAWLLEVWHLAGARVEFAWEPLVVYNIVIESISRSRRANWEDSLAWAEEYRAWISDRAFASFLSTKVALKAKRAGSWSGLRLIARKVLACKPGPLELMFLAGITALPNGILQKLWKRSLEARFQERKAGAV